MSFPIFSPLFSLHLLTFSHRFHGESCQGRPGSKATSCWHGPLVQLEASMPTRAQRLRNRFPREKLWLETYDLIQGKPLVVCKSNFTMAFVGDMSN